MRNLTILSRYSNTLQEIADSGDYVENACFDEFSDRLMVYTRNHFIYVYRFGGAFLGKECLEQFQGSDEGVFIV